MFLLPLVSSSLSVSLLLFLSNSPRVTFCNHTRNRPSLLSRRIQEWKNRFCFNFIGVFFVLFSLPPTPLPPKNPLFSLPSVSFLTLSLSPHPLFPSLPPPRPRASREPDQLLREIPQLLPLPPVRDLVRNLVLEGAALVRPRPVDASWQTPGRGRRRPARACAPPRSRRRSPS